MTSFPQIVHRHGLVQLNPAIRAEIDLPAAHSKCHWHRNGLTKRSLALWAADELNRQYRATEADNTDDCEDGQHVAVETHWTEESQQQPGTNPDTHSPSHPALDVVANCHSQRVYPNRIGPIWDAPHADASR